MLRTAILPVAPTDRPQNVTSPLLTLMSAEGRLVRSTPTGPWTSRHHRWEPVTSWWPDGIPALGTDEAQRALARRWLARFGPATVDDLRWWTGWNAGTVRRALGTLPIEEVDLHGEPGIALDSLDDDRPDDDLPTGGTAAPVATLLPALDPTPMGWKRRDWFLGIDRHHRFDRAGNIGPTLWWDGEIVGTWGFTSRGELRTAVVADRGADAATAIEDAAARLHRRLGGAVVTPAIRTPLERALVEGDTGSSGVAGRRGGVPETGTALPHPRPTETPP